MTILVTQLAALAVKRLEALMVKHLVALLHSVALTVKR
jgi:hypothetical protein